MRALLQAAHLLLVAQFEVGEERRKGERKSRVVSALGNQCFENFLCLQEPRNLLTEGQMWKGLLDHLQIVLQAHSCEIQDFGQKQFHEDVVK